MISRTSRLAVSGSALLLAGSLALTGCGDKKSTDAGTPAPSSSDMSSPTATDTSSTDTSASPTDTSSAASRDASSAENSASASDSGSSDTSAQGGDVKLTSAQLAAKLATFSVDGQKVKVSSQAQVDKANAGLAASVQQLQSAQITPADCKEQTIKTFQILPKDIPTAMGSLATSAIDSYVVREFPSADAVSSYLKQYATTQDACKSYSLSVAGEKVTSTSTNTSGSSSVLQSVQQTVSTVSTSKNPKGTKTTTIMGQRGNMLYQVTESMGNASVDELQKQEEQLATTIQG